MALVLLSTVGEGRPYFEFVVSLRSLSLDVPDQICHVSRIHCGGEIRTLQPSVKKATPL